MTGLKPIRTIRDLEAHCARIEDKDTGVVIITEEGQDFSIQGGIVFDTTPKAQFALLMDESEPEAGSEDYEAEIQWVRGPADDDEEPSEANAIMPPPVKEIDVVEIRGQLKEA